MGPNRRQATEDVTPHYRHFFTTLLQDRTDDRGIVQYLREDVAGDVIDTHTYNWGDRVRAVSLESIHSVIEWPSFGLQSAFCSSRENYFLQSYAMSVVETRQINSLALYRI